MKIKPKKRQHLFNEFIFSSNRLKTKYVDINIDCMMYDDESWSYPYNKLFDMARDKRYDNLLFVLGKDSYSRPVSYCGVYEILTEKHILGLECSCIEPLNYSSSINFRDDNVAVANLKSMKENIVDRIVELFDSNMDYSLKNNSFYKLLSVNSQIEDYYATGGEQSFMNPTNRNILILFDRSLGNIEPDISEKIIIKLSDRFIEEGSNLIRDYICDSYFWYLVAKESSCVLGSSVEDYILSKAEAFDESEIISALEDKLNVKQKRAVDQIIRVFNISEARMPSGHKAPDRFSLDQVCSYLFVDGLPTYLDYINMSNNTDNFVDGMVCSDVLCMLKEREQSCVSARDSYLKFKENLNNSKYLADQHKYNFYRYDEESFSKLVTDCSSAIKISYMNNDNKLLLFPDKIVDSIDMIGDSVDNLDDFEIIDGELRLR